LLSEEIGDLKDDGYDLSILGFEDDELADLLEEDQKTGLVDDDEVPEVQPEAITKPGDIWLLGKHRLLCGDSTIIDDISKLANGQLVDQLITDPPYNVAYEGKTKDAMKIKNDSMADDKFRQFLRDAFTAADTVMKPGAVFYIWHADLEGYNFRGACVDANWKVRQCLIWKKSTMVMGRQDYHWKHEPCLYGWKDGAGHLWATDRKQTTILEFDKPSRNGEHPCLPAGEQVFVNGEWMAIENVAIGDHTNYGPVIDISSHHANAIVELILEDGQSTSATTNHPFLVYSNGSIAWKEAGLISEDDYILTLERIHGTIKPCTKTALVTLQKKATGESPSMDGCEWSIALSGSSTTGQFLTECKSITEIMTSSTIQFQTSLLSLPLNTNGYTQIADLETEWKKSGASSVKNGGQSTASIGTITEEESGLQASASHASSSETSKEERFVFRKVGSVRTTQEKTKVYNLTIQGIPVFDTKIGVSHNTMKPVALFEYQMLNNTKGGDIVLDTFGGSGTTMIAAEKNGRIAYLCELDPKYCDVIIKRWQTWTGQKAILEISGRTFEEVSQK